MALQDRNSNRTPMYSQIDPCHPTAPPIRASASAHLYPTVDVNELDNLFLSTPRRDNAPSSPLESIEESDITIPGAILHLIDTHYSVELAAGDLRIIRLRQGDNTVAVLATVSDEIEWPLTKDLAAVKLDAAHYFLSFRTRATVRIRTPAMRTEQRRIRVWHPDLDETGLELARREIDQVDPYTRVSRLGNSDVRIGFG
ncbi:hypothetical protein OROMI_026566 [Orobanche minor]